MKINNIFKKKGTLSKKEIKDFGALVTMLKEQGSTLSCEEIDLLEKVYNTVKRS